MTMTFIDIVFSLIVLVLAVLAAAHGFIKELFSKIAVIAGVLCAFFFCGKLEPSIEKVINNSAVCMVISFILIFVAVFLFVKIVQTIIGSLFAGEILKSLDRVLGFFFGLVEGLVVVAVILTLMCAQPWFELQTITDSSVYYKILSPFLAKPVAYVGGMFV